MDYLTIALPTTVGALIAAVVELLKALGRVNDDNGGRLALVLSMFAGSILATLTEFGYVDLSDPKAAGILVIVGLVAEILNTFVGSFLTHKLVKAARIFPQHRS